MTRREELVAAQKADGQALQKLHAAIATANENIAKLNREVLVRAGRIAEIEFMEKEPVTIPDGVSADG